MLENLQPEVFDLLVVANILIALPIVARRFLSDIRRSPPPAEPGLAREATLKPAAQWLVPQELKQGEQPDDA